MKAIRFVLVSLTCFFAIICLLVGSYLYFTQESLIFHTSTLAKDYKFTYQRPFEEVNVTSFDGVHLSGLLFKSEHSKGLVFYLHGNAGALDTWGDIAANYTDLGYDIFILDYRGYGKSGGHISSEEQFYKDIDVAYKKLQTRYAENKIIIAGYSIGTGPATYLASQNHPKALLLLAPYYNLTALMNSWFPLTPGFLLKYKFATNDFLPKVSAPVYIFHGNRDHVIAYENSVRLSKLLRPSGHFYPLEGEDHIGINENTDFKKTLKTILQ